MTTLRASRRIFAPVQGFRPLRARFPRTTNLPKPEIFGGTLEKAQQIAAHESARTTKLYDRTSDTITLDEIEKIAI